LHRKYKKAIFFIKNLQYNLLISQDYEHIVIIF
jgi:hypothetical protein